MAVVIAKQGLFFQLTFTPRSLASTPCWLPSLGSPHLFDPFQVVSTPAICWLAFLILPTAGFIRGPSALLDNSRTANIYCGAGKNWFKPACLSSLIISLVGGFLLTITSLLASSDQTRVCRHIALKKFPMENG